MVSDSVPLLDKLDSSPQLPSPRTTRSWSRRYNISSPDNSDAALLTAIVGAFLPPNPRPLGGCHCPSDLHHAGYLHTIIQDWYQQHCYLGRGSVRRVDFSYRNTFLIPL